MYEINHYNQYFLNIHQSYLTSLFPLLPIYYTMQCTAPGCTDVTLWYVAFVFDSGRAFLLHHSAFQAESNCSLCYTKQTNSADGEAWFA